MKNLTNFRKRVETGVDLNLLVNCPENQILDHSCKYNVASWFALGQLIVGVLTPLCLI